MTNSHGGKREGAGSGGPREGAGRPRTRWNAGSPGQIWIVEKTSLQDKNAGFPAKPQQWRLLGIDEDGTIEFQNVETEEIISFIHPDKYT